MPKALLALALAVLVLVECAAAASVAVQRHHTAQTLHRRRRSGMPSEIGLNLETLVWLGNVLAAGGFTVSEAHQIVHKSQLISDNQVHLLRAINEQLHSALEKVHAKSEGNPDESVKLSDTSVDRVIRGHIHSLIKNHLKAEKDQKWWSNFFPTDSDESVLAAHADTYTITKAVLEALRALQQKCKPGIVSRMIDKLTRKSKVDQEPQPHEIISKHILHLETVMKALDARLCQTLRAVIMDQLYSITHEMRRVERIVAVERVAAVEKCKAQLLVDLDGFSETSQEFLVEFADRCEPKVPWRQNTDEDPTNGLEGNVFDIDISFLLARDCDSSCKPGDSECTVCLGPIIKKLDGHMRTSRDVVRLLYDTSARSCPSPSAMDEIFEPVDCGDDTISEEDAALAKVHAPALSTSTEESHVVSAHANYRCVPFHLGFSDDTPQVKHGALLGPKEMPVMMVDSATALDWLLDLQHPMRDWLSPPTKDFILFAWYLRGLSVSLKSVVLMLDGGVVPILWGLQGFLALASDAYFHMQKSTGAPEHCAAVATALDFKCVCDGQKCSSETADDPRKCISQGPSLLPEKLKGVSPRELQKLFEEQFGLVHTKTSIAMDATKHLLTSGLLTSGAYI